MQWKLKLESLGDVFIGTFVLGTGSKRQGETFVASSADEVRAWLMGYSETLEDISKTEHPFLAKLQTRAQVSGHIKTQVSKEK